MRPWRVAMMLVVSAAGLTAHQEIGYAAGERIAHLTVAASGRDLVVSGELVQWFSRPIEADISHGISKDLFFYILLKRRQAYWFDEEVLAKTIQRTIQYDLLTKRYLVAVRDDPRPAGRPPGVGSRQEMFEDLEAARALLSRINRATMASRDILRPGETYYISMKAEMRASHVPRYLEYFLFLIPFLDVSTPWADSLPLSAASP